MKRYRLSKLADQDLDEIADYIAVQNPPAAIRQLERLLQSFEILASNPLMGEVCDFLRPHLRMFSTGNYVIFYLPGACGIEVSRVIHGARDFKSLFSS
jgi:toxin ParE1/3/4